MGSLTHARECLQYVGQSIIQMVRMCDNLDPLLYTASAFEIFTIVPTIKASNNIYFLFYQ